MNKKYILLGISALALFASIFSDASAFTGTGCTINPYKTVDGMSVFPGFSCHVTGSGLLDFGSGTVTAGGPTSPGNNYNFWFTSGYGTLGYCRLVATTPVSTTVTGSYSSISCPSSILSLPYGEQGPQGPTGATGATGPIGATGATGAMGLSAFDLAVANGFTGSEVQWVLSLQGSGTTVYLTNTGGETSYIATGSFLIGSTEGQGNIYVSDNLFYIIAVPLLFVIFTVIFIWGIFKWFVNILNLNFSKKK